MKEAKSKKKNSRIFTTKEEKELTERAKREFISSLAFMNESVEGEPDLLRIAKAVVKMRKLPPLGKSLIRDILNIPGLSDLPNFFCILRRNNFMNLPNNINSVVSSIWQAFVDEEHFDIIRINFDFGEVNATTYAVCTNPGKTGDEAETFQAYTEKWLGLRIQINNVHRCHLPPLKAVADFFEILADRKSFRPDTLGIRSKKIDKLFKFT